MSVGSLLFRSLATVAIGVGVFLASMSITQLVHGGDPVSMSTIESDSPPTTPTFLSSTDPVVVATTAPPTAAPSSTAAVVTTTTPPLAFRSQPPPLPELDDVFDAMVDDLESRLFVPVRLPAEFNANHETLIADGMIDSDSYLIHVGRDCEDATVCRVATFTAQRSALANPQLGGSGTDVPLPNGLTGRFSDGTCGEGCNNAFITWIEDGVRYSVGSNVISGRDVLDLAWRSIDRSLPSPTAPEVCGPGHPKHDGAVATVLTPDPSTDGLAVDIHWVAVCSALGIDAEFIAAPGVLSWADVNSDGSHDLAVTHDDGSSTLFIVDENRPRAIIDLGTSERLRVGDLGCAIVDGQERAIDVSTGEIIDFVGTLTAQRVLPDEGSIVDALNCQF